MDYEWYQWTWTDCKSVLHYMCGWMCLCECVQVYVCVCKCMCVCVSVCVCVCTSMCVRKKIFFVCALPFECVWIYVCVWMLACVCVHMCVFVCACVFFDAVYLSTLCHSTLARIMPKYPFTRLRPSAQKLYFGTDDGKTGLCPSISFQFDWYSNFIYLTKQ